MNKIMRVEDVVLAYFQEYGKFGESLKDIARRQFIGFVEFEKAYNSRNNGTGHTVDGQSKPKHTRLTAGLATPQNKFASLIAYVLYNNLRNKATIGEVFSAIENVFGKTLNDYDMEPIPSDGVLRWKKNTQFARQRMVDDGLLLALDQSGRGNWELSESGIEYAKGLKLI